MFKTILDAIVGRKEPTEERLGRVEKKVSEIDLRLTVLSAKVNVKHRNHMMDGPRW